MTASWSTRCTGSASSTSISATHRGRTSGGCSRHLVLVRCRSSASVSCSSGSGTSVDTARSSQAQFRAGVQTGPVLEVDGLVKRYGATLALDGVSFAVEPGQVFGFVGRNGAGKTTTMRIVLGVLAADAGSVRWHGRPVDAAVRRRTGYMPEERGLYPKMRVRDQLTYLAELHGAGRRDARAASDHWVERLGLTDRARDRVETLSLGNQQR